jgi:AcrR family transcriptional regulator
MRNTRDIILETALQAFSHQGYFDTTTKQIASESNINETTFFYHFPDKCTLYQAVIDKYYHCPDVPLAEVAQRLAFENIKNDLFELSVTYSEMTMSNINILRIMLGRIPLSPEIEQASFSALPQISEHFEQYLSLAIARKLIPEANYLLPYKLFVSHITRLVIDLNVHDHITKLTKQVKEKLYPQLEEMCQFYADNFFI